jgi:hypothetical protein
MKGTQRGYREPNSPRRGNAGEKVAGLSPTFSMRPLDSDTNGIVYTEDRHSGKERNSCVLVKYLAAQE